MAVAVKTSPGARSDSSTGNTAKLSLIGVAYLLGCLAVVFKILPSLWWSIFEGLGVSRAYSVELGALLVLLCIGIGYWLLTFGGRLLGPSPPQGVRGGVFLGFVSLLLVLLLARWASLWIEHFVDRGVLSEYFGISAAAAVLILLLAGAIYLFLSRRAQRWASAIEEGGWFAARSYKPNQGRMVRRATIIGILLLVLAGIWTMVSHGVLRRMPDDWVLNIPFTGRVAVENFGDARRFVADVVKDEKLELEVRTPGETSWSEKSQVSADEYRKAVLGIAKAHHLEGVLQINQFKVAEGVPDEKDVTALVLAVNQVILDRMEAILAKKGKERIFENESALRRLREAYNNSSTTDVREAVLVFEREAKQYQKTKELGDEFKLPTALVILDRAALQKINEQTLEKNYVRVGLTTAPFPIPYNRVVRAEKPANPEPGRKGDQLSFNEAEVLAYTDIAFVRLRPAMLGGQKLKADEVFKSLREASSGEDFKNRLRGWAQEVADPLGRDLKTLEDEVARYPLPERKALSKASGTEHFASIPLLPGVKFTLPILLLAGSIWLAWRVVNLPTFADFLIATEAEMNKVSWTTQKRLVQDTIVVLATLFLMAVFLFAMDWTWKVVLSWEKIGVLYIPPEQEDKQAEQKRW